MYAPSLFSQSDVELWKTQAFPKLEAFSKFEVLTLADGFLESGYYDEAVTEYKRFIFFNPESDLASYAIYRMGLAYRSVFKWQNAIDAFKASISATKDPITADERRLTMATTLIASGNFSLAKLELDKISSNHPQLCLRSQYFSGVASLYMHDWNAALEALNKFYYGYGDPLVKEHYREVNSALISAQNSYKSAILAKCISIVIPGLGQMYAGDWRDGLNALVLNSIFIGLIAESAHKSNYKRAVFIFSISLRYYMGNIYHAEEDVIKYNESLDRQNALRVLNLIRADEPR